MGSSSWITIYTQLIKAIPNSTITSLVEQGPLRLLLTLKDNDYIVKQESGSN
jgi:hypothetical protein